jgi:PAS domain S-box-containing protein
VRVITGAIPSALDVFYRTPIEEAPDAIIYADVGGMIRFWNRGAERIFGFSQSEALGKSLDLIIPEHLRQRHWDVYAQTMRSGQTRYGTGVVLAVPAMRKDGARVSIEFNVLPFRDREGRMVGAAAILRDVGKRFDEIKALRKELTSLQKRLEGPP